MKIIKNGNLMIVSNDEGIIDSRRDIAAGLYLEDTRFCSAFYLETDRGMKKLQSKFGSDFIINRYLFRSSPLSNHFDILLEETMIVSGNKLLLKLRLTNYSNGDVDINLKYVMKSGYEDIFVVREVNDSYFGLSERGTTSEIQEDKGLEYEDASAFYRIEKELPEGHFALGPKQTLNLKGYLHFYKVLKSSNIFKDMLEDRPIRFPSRPIEELAPLVKQSIGALKMLMIPTRYGDFPAAGLPWYATIFGRDSLIFALQTLETFPETARTVLEVLGIFQAVKIDDFKDSVPGKIIHEVRLNYLSLSNQIPFEQYYGTIDATLLYIILAGKYLEVTGDTKTIEKLLPNIEAAERWIYEYGDADGDGYIEYRPVSERGLQTQGWKDSGDSVSFKEGELAHPPIAFVEVQGYLYLAYHYLSFIYTKLGKTERATELLERSRNLKENFNKDFWMESEGYFAIALDGNKRKVDSISSNPGQCLFTGIIDDEKVEAVVRKLMSSELFSGWGIRTLSIHMKRYNPFSYHNGSVWPHDNSIIIMGLLKYGYTTEAKKISMALLDAMKKFDDKLLPELFSGLSKEETGGDIVEYPTSCSPQLWSIGTIFTINQALRPVKREG
ncbi:amylo-alpha-1,6-glucosidase [Kosmotoga pacifica]|uniref:Glycogen debranching protein n=1 Tax=Kosmotoga pacifica TaxID=1330330 RepID=A0A0G2ZDI7_9BACT|nr:amylo-alpha-1,6-glucosidase [Kosmotoga pacifica]AKI97604.1 hypothetical protein IX53_06975 [Kosmotoga pacifica]